MKIKESQLRRIIRESINEYRGMLDLDNGDTHYIRPNGKDTGLRQMSNGKRTKNNITMADGTRGTSKFASMATDHGKGALCRKASEQIVNILLGNNKIVWTPKEMEAIRNIMRSFGDLAQLTKEEGNKKRGYTPDKQNDEFFSAAAEE